MCIHSYDLAGEAFTLVCGGNSTALIVPNRESYELLAWSFLGKKEEHWRADAAASALFEMGKRGFKPSVRLVTATMTKLRHAGKCRAASALFAKLRMLARLDEFDEALFVTVQVRASSRQFGKERMDVYERTVLCAAKPTVYSCVFIV